LRGRKKKKKRQNSRIGQKSVNKKPVGTAAENAQGVVCWYARGKGGGKRGLKGPKNGESLGRKKGAPTLWGGGIGSNKNRHSERTLVRKNSWAAPREKGIKLQGQKIVRKARGLGGEGRRKTTEKPFNNLFGGQTWSGDGTDPGKQKP